jgi:hypothetical protein
MATEVGLREFCIDVATKVAGAACQLARSLLSRPRASRTSACVLGTFGAMLEGIAYDLKNADRTMQNMSERRFRKFLRQLEAVCTVSSTTVSRTRPRE